VKVRRHADGRTIVYGVLKAGAGGAPFGWRGWAGGKMFPANTPDSELVQEIKRCALFVEDHCIAGVVIAGLPPVDI